MRVNKGLDVLKFLMCIMIILIHIRVTYLLPIIRVAVPVFFIISSYLFFARLPEVNASSNSYLRKFILRGLKLYVFWFIVLLPVTFYVKGWYKMDFVSILGNFVYDVFLNGTFMASWYISAYVIGITLLYFFRRWLTIFAVISFCLYIICCAVSTYYYLFGFMFYYVGHGYKIINSFPAGLLFIFFGYLFASGHVLSLKKSLKLTIIGSILFFTESYLIFKYGWVRETDCYLSSIILAPALFSLFKHYPELVKFPTNNLRKCTTIIYCSHYSFIVITYAVYNFLFNSLMKDSLLFSVVLIICTIFSVLLIKISHYPPFKWVRFAY